MKRSAASLVRSANGIEILTPLLWGFMTRQMMPRNDTPLAALLGEGVYEASAGGVCYRNHLS